MEVNMKGKSDRKPVDLIELLKGIIYVKVTKPNGETRVIYMKDSFDKRR